ncbi:MAG: hypothetical protein ACHREM_31945 [Polyangiales bacterium]
MNTRARPSAAEVDRRRRARSLVVVVGGSADPRAADVARSHDRHDAEVLWSDDIYEGAWRSLRVEVVRHERDGAVLPRLAVVRRRDGAAFAVVLPPAAIERVVAGLREAAIVADREGRHRVAPRRSTRTS